jgi:hypothetical protein
MGVVYEALQPSLHRRVALKVLPTGFTTDPRRLQRFTVEAQAAAAVAHPHIIPVYAVGEDRGVYYYAMRLVDGHALDWLTAAVTRSRREPVADEPPPSNSPSSGEPVLRPGVLVDLARQSRPAYRRAIARLGATVARALDHAHQNGVVHRDVKPANLLLGRDGHAWVTDFGLAQLPDSRSVTRTGVGVGTFRYMSPEQASGDRRRLDHRTDVYSLAATLYELLTGRAAFPAEEPVALLWQIAHEAPAAPRALDPHLPMDLETVLLKALAKEPRERYATAAEFADDLDRFLAGEPVLARRPSAWDRAKRWAGRHPATVATALVTLLVVGIASGVATALVAAEQAETGKAYRETQAAHQEAQQARLAADALAKSEKHRADEAEKRFQRAKVLGDLVLTISEEEMGSDRPLQGPRRRLLLAALENSRRLLDDGHDDPGVRAELATVVSRVEGLLAEQDLRWEADGAFLMRDPHVRAELQLTPDQARRVDRAFPPPPPGKGPGKGPRPPDPSQETKNELVKSLTVQQRQRLRQISIQLRAPMVFNDPEVIDPLNLYPLRQQIREILTEEFGGLGPFRPGGPKQPPGADKDAKARALERILDLLTPEQRESWRALVGKPYTPNR